MLEDVDIAVLGEKWLTLFAWIVLWTDRERRE
jgi:hypothetical protein